MLDLEIKQVSKCYWLPRATPNEGLRAVWTKLWPSYNPFWALRDVSFTVDRGEALGIIGPNGAGKSTLLKLLSEITAPTTGQLRLHGRLSALIEVGSGFHPELTGRENVFLSGSILGMRRTEISAKLDQIVDFAGIGDFINAPVKWYSSGMYVRLGFAIAAHLDPQILLVDEALAVGDEAFQRKCYERITALRASGKTIVFISHDLYTVERLCSRAILMRNGRVALDGDAREVVSAYRLSVAGGMAQSDAPSLPQAISITSVSATPRRGRTVATGHPLGVRVSYQAVDAVDDVVFELWYCTHGGSVLHCEQTTAVYNESLDIPAGRGDVEFQCDALGLQPGTYSLLARVRSRTGDIHHVFDAGIPLVVEPGVQTRGSFFMPYTWRAAPRAVPVESGAA